MINELKVIFDQDDFEIARNETDKQDKIKNCDVLLVLANEQYSISEELMKDFDDFIKFTKPLIVINLEKDVILRPEFKAYYKSIDFYNDTNNDNLNGEGSCFVDLVFELSRNLPKTLIESEKKFDLLVIVSVDLRKHLDYLKSKYKVKFSHPREQLNPNFQAAKECKILLAVIDNEVASSRKCFEEMKFCRQFENQIIYIKLCDEIKLNTQLKEIINDSVEIETKNGTESLTNNTFRKNLQRRIKDILNRKSFEEKMFSAMEDSEKVI